MRDGSRILHGVRGFGGGGGEAWVRNLLRVLLAAVLGLLLLLGLRDVVRPFVAARPAPARISPTAVYPREPAEAFAARFAMAYLTFDGAHPDVRQRALAAYLIDGGDPGLGWDGNGKQTALEGVPAGIQVESANRALVTVAVLVDQQRWIYLAVPVVSDQGGLAVAAAPALVPPPGRASWQQPSNTTSDDQDSTLSSQLRPSLTAFFRAYAASRASELAYYAAPGAEIQGLGGEVELGELSDLSVMQGGSDERDAVATVRWLDRHSGASLSESYRLRLAQVDGKWLVGQVSPE
jgi:Conjugative transposon protein TcpC